MNPLIGPHEGRELELMLANEKPAALFSFLSHALPFDNYLRNGRFVATMVADCRHQSMIITQPDETHRALFIDSVYRDVRKRGHMREADHIAIGTYLGYTTEEIAAFLAHSAALDAREGSDVRS